MIQISSNPLLAHSLMIYSGTEKAVEVPFPAVVLLSDQGEAPEITIQWDDLKLVLLHLLPLMAMDR